MSLLTSPNKMDNIRTSGSIDVSDTLITQSSAEPNAIHFAIVRESDLATGHQTWHARLFGGCSKLSAVRSFAHSYSMYGHHGSKGVTNDSRGRPSSPAAEHGPWYRIRAPVPRLSWPAPPLLPPWTRPIIAHGCFATYSRTTCCLYSAGDVSFLTCHTAWAFSPCRRILSSSSYG